MNKAQIIEVFMTAYAFLVHSFTVVWTWIATVFVGILAVVLAPWITNETIIVISSFLALLCTIALYVNLFVFVFKGIGQVLTGGINLVFTQGPLGIRSLVYGAMARIFTSIGWIFNSIGNWIKKPFQE